MWIKFYTDTTIFDASKLVQSSDLCLRKKAYKKK